MTCDVRIQMDAGDFTYIVLPYRGATYVSSDDEETGTIIQ